MPATGNHQSDVGRLSCNRPRIKLHALAGHLGGRNLHPRQAAGRAHVGERNFRMLKQKFAYRILGPAERGQIGRHYLRQHHDTRCALGITVDVMNVGYPQILRHAMQALQHILFLGFLLRTTAENILRAVGKSQRNTIHTAREAVAFLGKSRPALRHALLVLGKHGIGVTHLTEHRHRAGGRQGTTEVLLHQAQCAPDARTGRMLGVGPEQTKA